MSRSPWWTGRPAASCSRSANWACWTRTGDRNRRAPSTSIRRATGRWPAGWRRSRWSCWTTPTGCSPGPRHPGRSRGPPRGGRARDARLLLLPVPRPRPPPRGPPRPLHPDRPGLPARRTPGRQGHVRRGLRVSDPDTAGFAEAVARAAEADVCVAVLGDRAGLFGRGTSGEGCDVADLRLPGVQAELLDALLTTGVPVILVLLTGRPYALGRWHGRLGAVVQAFFPGEEGGPALAGVLSGRVNPSGRLPVSVPRMPGGQPWTYLQPPLGLAGEVSSLDPTPLYPFGHGRSYTSFTWQDHTGNDVTEIGTDGSYDLSLTVRNTGERAGAEVVQLYLHDPVASVTRPDVRLIGYQRVELTPGEARRVTFRFHPDLSSFTDRTGARVVEPGALELRLGPSSAEVRHTARLRLTGPVRVVGADRRLRCEVEVSEGTD
ncbi:glycoside hydrolase family 3 C-terminal domain-containing protein [Streptomyces diastatochromogenes]|nr:glycoside hydrolase family 3 C-terminal domain-containing protein [Streptomyces diastatochromogenes]